MTPQAIADVLAECTPFHVLDRVALQALAAQTVPRRLRTGQILFAQGDPGTSAYVLVDGSVKLSFPGRDGDELVIRTVRRHEVFGELALLDGVPRSTWAEVTSPATVIVIDQTAWTALLAERRVVEALLADLATRLRATTTQLAEHALVDLTGRVAAALLRLAETHGAADGDAIRIDMPVTQGQLAAMVAASRQSVNQVLRSMERRGDIRMQDRTIVLCRVDALRRRGAF